MKSLTVKEQNTKAINKAVVLSALRKEAAPLFRKLSKLEAVTSVAEYDLAATNLKALKGILKTANQKEDAIINPIKASIKETQALFAPFKEDVAEAETKTKLMMSVFVESQKKLEAKVEQDFEAGKIKNISTASNKIASLQVKSKAASVRGVSYVEIEDEKKIPREYMVPDLVAIKAALKVGKKVPGAVLKTKTSIAV